MEKRRVRGSGSRSGAPSRFLAALAVSALIALAVIAPSVFPRNSDPATRPENWDGVAPSVPAMASTPLHVLPPDLEAARHRVYPYSIIPGGIESGSELTTAFQHDPVVAAHYSDFDIAHARTMRLEQQLPVYVSYRLGEKVFWTKRKLILAKGETLITDGTHLARTRCGNRVSETPQVPVAKAEPPLKALETPIDPGLPSELETPTFATASATPVVLPSNPGGAWFFLPVVPFFPGGGGGGSSSSGTPPPIGPIPPPIPPTAPTPEPATLLLVSMGVAGAWAVRNKPKS